MEHTVAAIDVHAHYGQSGDQPFALADRLLSGDADVVVKRARLANIAITIVSPLRAFLPRARKDALAANREARDTVAGYPELRQWAVVDPLTPETYRQAAELLTGPKCVGIKIHPELDGYPIAEHGREIFSFAEEHGAVVQTHSGEARSLPADFLPFADEFPTVRLILSHLGHSVDGDVSLQVRAVQAAKHGNVYTDTSSAKSVFSNLLEWAVDEIGSERILFGSDTPLYYSPMQRARVDWADIRDEDKRRILRDNAVAMFKLGQV